jgi:mannose-6-phosphate isomerase-like protein (cupin superfamily)
MSTTSPDLRKINLEEAFGRIPEPWQPRLAGRVNDVHIKLAKLDGEFIWHRHEEEDELFLVVKGTLRMRFRDRDVVLEPGEMLVVPRGVEHLPVAEEGEVHALLVEPASTLNTGDVVDERTVRELEEI